MREVLGAQRTALWAEISSLSARLGLQLRTDLLGASEYASIIRQYLKVSKRGNLRQKLVQV